MSVTVPRIVPGTSLVLSRYTESQLTHDPAVGTELVSGGAGSAARALNSSACCQDAELAPLPGTRPRAVSRAPDQVGPWHKAAGPVRISPCHGGSDAPTHFPLYRE